MTDPRNIAHDKKVQQEKKHRHEEIAPGGDAKPQPGKKTHMEHHASDKPKAADEAAEDGTAESSGKPQPVEMSRISRRSQFTKPLARALWLVFGAGALSVAFAADPPAHIRGTIVSATADSLSLKTSDGNMNVAIDPATRIAGVVPSSLDRIKAGTFVGIANVPGSGASSALEVVVFPDAMKGSGLGDYPWDLSPPATRSGTQSAMTNGTVKSSATAGAATTSAMTNGTVKNTSNARGLVLTVDYGKGEKTIEVPSGVPVVGLVPADSSKLLPGAHVFVATKKEAPKSAAFIAVGIDGTVPPM